MDPVEVALGQTIFADGTKNKNIYLKGFEAGVNVVMQYWKNGVDEAKARENLEHIKNALFSTGKNSNMDNKLGGSKNGK